MVYLVNKVASMKMAVFYVPALCNMVHNAYFKERLLYGQSHGHML